MISLPNNLPLVRFSDGQVIQFERGWLAGTLARAAERAGYKKWWLAPHVTESVTSYLEQDFPESIVAIGRLDVNPGWVTRVQMRTSPVTFALVLLRRGSHWSTLRGPPAAATNSPSLIFFVRVFAKLSRPRSSAWKFVLPIPELNS